MGIVSVGAAVGGIFFSVVLQALFRSYNWKVSILVLLAILSGLIVAGNMLVDTDADKEGRRPEDIREWLNCVKSARFWLLCYCVFGKNRLLDMYSGGPRITFITSVQI